MVAYAFGAETSRPLQHATLVRVLWLYRQVFAYPRLSTVAGVARLSIVAPRFVQSYTMAKKNREPDRKSSGKSGDAPVETDTEDTNPDSAKAEVTLATVRDKAMELLARREHSRAELKDKLKRREYEYPADFIETVLDDFAERNLQSDERFAEVYVRSRINRGFGETKIRSELQSRGVTGDVMLLALEAADVNWHDNAEAALTKKFSSAVRAENVRSQKIRAKMQRFLQNRGYNPDQIISAVNRMADLVEANAESSLEPGTG